MAADAVFPRLVSLACHDLRTPLATVTGFAHTLARLDDLAPPADRYLQMMIAASGEMGELLDALGLIARIEAGTYEPLAIEVDSLELARTAAARLGDKAAVDGTGGAVAVDPEPVRHALYALARCALRHGGLERVTVAVSGPELRLSPITEAAAPVVLAQELRDLGAAVGLRVIGAFGGTALLDGHALVVRLPAAGGG